MCGRYSDTKEDRKWRKRHPKEAAAIDQVASLLKPYATEEIESYAVSPLVNSPKNIGADCVLPVATP